MGKSSDYIIRIQAQNQQLKRKLAETRGQLKGYNSSIAKLGREAVTSLGMFFGISTIGFAIAGSIRKIADFEFQMDKVAAVSRASAAEVKQLEKNALDLGASTKFTATEIGKMQEEIARLGFSTPKILDTTDAIRKLATVADSELGDAAKVMVGTLNSFNLSAKESERVANVMGESFSRSALDLEKFQVGMANSGAIANVLGHTLEENTARLGALTDANIDASKAGTDLRRIYLELNSAGLTYDEAMEMIAKSSDKAGLAQRLFKVRASGAAVILSNQRERVKELTSAYADSNKELDSMVDIMEDNLLTDWKLFTSAIDGVIQKGGALNSFFRETTQGMTRFVNVFNSFDLKKWVTFSTALATGGAVSANEVLKTFDKMEEGIQKIEDRADFDLGTEAIEVFQQAQKDGIKTIKEFMAVQGQYVHFSKLPEERYKILAQVIQQYDEAQKKAARTQAQIDELNKEQIVTLGSLRDDLKELKELQEEASIANVGNINDQIEALEKLIKKYEAATGKVAKFNDSLKGISTGTKEFENLFNSIDESAFSGKKEFEMVGLGNDNAILKRYKEGTEEYEAAVQERFNVLNSIADRGVADMISSFAEGLGTGGLDKAFQNLFESIGGGLQVLGKALIAFGVSMEAFKKAFKNPFVAIGAGVAAIAAGALVKRAASNLSMSAAGGGGGYSSSGGGGGSFSDNFTQQKTIRLELTGRLKADTREIYAALENHSIRQSRIR